MCARPTGARWPPGRTPFPEQRRPLPFRRRPPASRRSTAKTPTKENRRLQTKNPFPSHARKRGSIPGSRCRRSRWTAERTAAAAERTEAGPRLLRFPARDRGIFALPTPGSVMKCHVLVCQANWRKVGGGSPLERRSNRSTFLREPCVCAREGAGEASAAVWAGRAIEQRKDNDPGRRDFRNGRRPHRLSRFGERHAGPAVSETPCTFARLLSGPWEVFELPCLSWRGRIGKGGIRSL